MTKLKWTRVTDSDGETVMYVAVGDQPDSRKPYRSYRIVPGRLLTRLGVGDNWYTVTLWQGDTVLARIGSVHHRANPGLRGEWILADAKHAAQDHYDAARVGV